MSERRRHFRGRARPGRVIPVRFRTTEGAWREAETRNIGIGGSFIVCADAPGAGTELVVSFALPTNERRFELPAIVRWVAPDGMGVQFVNVDVDVLLELNDYFATLTGQ